jgi:putative phosphotransacetylase
MKIKTEVSARHIHLSIKDLEKLFGKSYSLKSSKKISQPGQFASTDTITIIGKKSEIKNVRVVGPIRENSQLEISQTDAIKLGIKAPVRISGNIKDAPKIKIKGKKGTANVPVIVAKRHIHLSDKEAKKYKLNDKQILKNNKMKKIKKSAQEFKEEFRKALNTGIVAAFGFLIALVWRDLITEYVENLTKLSPIQGKLYSAIIITIIAVVGILIVTKLTKPKDEKK